MVLRICCQSVSDFVCFGFKIVSHLCLVQNPDAKKFIEDDCAKWHGENEQVALWESLYEMEEDEADELGEDDVEEDFEH